ncbi:hypothetical protein OX90_11615 [Pseudomonas coronafaciens pv. porri]|uniref:Uncharacterized protein n=1 Tax=Pseudomonas coronafaciens pv. porri TaxID=83964 RepID=A0ABR5JPJ9_9PSED|nr:hypothetical protein OA77_15315 [Pseudomonas coronafaciens]KOP51079.1 hypothetical protein OX88_26445 [Pseudomonas coronafaciens pv. porri]KOP59365.1 hypothetical protein OX90_11615 [Pseudomonas coronafaciens pv. porri]
MKATRSAHCKFEVDTNAALARAGRCAGGSINIYSCKLHLRFMGLGRLYYIAEIKFTLITVGQESYYTVGVDT